MFKIVSHTAPNYLQDLLIKTYEIQLEGLNQRNRQQAGAPKTTLRTVFVIVGRPSGIAFQQMLEMLSLSSCLRKTSTNLHGTNWASGTFSFVIYFIECCTAIM